jgi:hypothetical protein
MKLLQAFRAMGAAFALVLLGALAQAALSPFWSGTAPSTFGPWLGDQNVNLGRLWQAFTSGQGMGYSAGISASQVAGQANCTQLVSDSRMYQISTSAAAGYVCLPTAVPGREALIANATTQTINIYSSAASFVGGTADTINGTAGTTAYAGLTTGKNADCFTAAGGAWYCASAN